MVNLKNIKKEYLKNIYLKKDTISIWYYEKGTQKAFLIDYFDNEYYNYNDFIDFYNQLQEIYFYNKEKSSEVLYSLLHTSDELKQIGQNDYIIVKEA